MFSDELGIATVQYQKRAEACVQAYLNSFSPSSKSHELKTTDLQKKSISIRIRENPPSVQIQQSPQGGKLAGLLRIQEKLELPEDTEMIGKFVVPKTKILIAQESDLTRECIILTMRDDTVNTILENGLIAPEQVAAMLHKFRNGHPDFFIMVQRYLMGMEHTDGYKVPYGIITQKDEPAFEYLEILPQNLF